MVETKKKTVLITGAGQGIGQAIALRFAAEGCNIVAISNALSFSASWTCS